MTDILYGPKFVTLIGANMDEEDIVDITGWEGYKQKGRTLLQDGTRLLKFLVQEEETHKFFFWTFFLKLEEQMSKGGKFVFIDEYGNLSFYAFEPPAEMINPRKSWRGENSITRLLQSFTHYSPAGMGDSWMENMTANSCTFKELCDGQVKGLNRLLLNFAEKGQTVGCLMTERNGYQNIETHPDLIFRSDPSGEVPAVFLNHLHKFNEEGAYNPIRGKIDLSEVISVY